MKSIELFAGIGGIALAAEWAGIETVAFCEREPFCQKVLNKHWPNVPMFDDVRTLNRQVLEEMGIEVGAIDIISGGSLANLSVLPGSEKAKMMTVTSGRKLSDCSKKSGPLGLLVKMLLGTSHWASTKCFLTWRASVTPGNRLLYRLVPSTPLAEETESLLSPMFPTPAASDTRGLNDYEKTMVKLTNGERAHLGQLPNYLMILTGKRGRTNPDFVEKIMGFPTGWTELER